ncbi:hypothetical protein HMPREF1981_03135 [Bacteroides pyogenes F0041]|uniref:Uncharacterized protein n=2 Tax=Bacteroides pyogenes TaxID=310300 RepID=U2CAE2_9BACE|nr:hypothetical protein HMPREF1981_03135 [Bacteroides pyogenes F0041]GAE17332.1 hypothetical protein JCM6294_63 [Bacteroides pyogenes DSM 20611 = JCM 6294]
MERRFILFIFLIYFITSFARSNFHLRATELSWIPDIVFICGRNGCCLFTMGFHSL